ncbi:integrin alpha-D-like [Genypterus blacodes]|uniref:integrin alpha-D-like n=1 Tax=Genypterus blacodes TaxID=154954 RepID=UPI003F770455
MDRLTFTAVCLSVFRAAVGFNIDPGAWKTLKDPSAGFGYKVVQRKSDLLVSAPLHQYEPNRRGQIHLCSTTSCRFLPLQLPDFAVNMSLGLTMTSDPTSKMTLACGPTIPKDCRSITKYNGACLQIVGSNKVGGPLPSSHEECATQHADIAFLMDGSGSVSPADFRRTKAFVKGLIRSFQGRGTQFAIIQFSSNVVVHYYFDSFPLSTGWERQIDSIQQLGSSTATAEAINHIVNYVFIRARGSRPDAKKVLIVITDGESNDHRKLPKAAAAAEAKKIVRFAVGVGNAFLMSTAKLELDTIASSPPTEHVFKVDNYAALDIIKQSLQDRIFAIEGSQSSGESLRMEMAQEGFSAALVTGGTIEMGTVGAFEWRGGYQSYTTAGVLIKSEELSFMQPDSYLGYSMTVAKTMHGTMAITGAPRYEHRGIAMTFLGGPRNIDPSPWQHQIGAYFGAEVCAIDVNNDLKHYTDQILISAPMYMDDNREGRVYVCSITGWSVDCRFDFPLILAGDAVGEARFGSTLAAVPDLNKDGLNDLIVGAPLENDRQGSIYIFNGNGQGSINPKYSQRITGAEVKSGLRFFGLSVSGSSFDHSGDGLPDLAVGSKGAVVLLRSKPIVMVTAQVSFNPSLIPTPNCTMPLPNRAKICFTMTPLSNVQTAQGRIDYTFTLDATRKPPSNRAYITNNKREESQSFTLDFGQRCHSVDFFIESCPEDVLKQLSNELKFSFEGVLSSDNLRPCLSQLSQTQTYHPLGFQINCGTDETCVDDLRVDLNFTKSTEVRVGIDELLEVTVSVENREENSYYSRVILTYPAGISFRKFTALHGRIECNSFDSEDVRGTTDCSVDKPIFRSKSKGLFVVSYGINTKSNLGRRISITANATSGNGAHSSTSKLYQRREIDVKYSIFTSIESTLSYSNFSYGMSDLQKPVKHTVTVSNVLRALNITVVIKVPMQLGDKYIWVDPSSFQISGCQRHNDEKPPISDFVALIQKMKIVDCSVASCAVFRCIRFMAKNQQTEYLISANLSSGWIEQIGLASAKFLLTSTASLDYNRDQYIFFSSGSNYIPPIRRIEAEVEVYAEKDFTREIVGASVGGLVLLALITAGLYKAGFFKSRYKNMIKNEDETPDGLGEGGEAPEQQT